MVLAFGLVNAQKAKRTSAYNYWKDGKLDKAKEYIDPSILDPSTISDAKTWLYRGYIYLDIHRSNKPEYKNLAADALSIAFESYKKAKELDEKKEYSQEIYAGMDEISKQFFNSGATLFQASEFTNAATDFEKALSVSQAMSTIDTMAIYAAALSYSGAKDYTKSASFYEQLVGLKYNKAEIYSSLCSDYSELKLADKAEAILEQGRKLYPNDLNIIIAQSNLYLQQNNPTKALPILSLAREKDPSNKSIIFAMGTNYDLLQSDTTKTEQERLISLDKAVQAYKDAIALDSIFFDAVYNLGALYYNNGVIFINKANKLPYGDKNYDILFSQANDHFRMSLPYFEKASRIHPNDTNALVSLKEIYTRLQMYDKQKDVNARLQGK
ncbi:MAG: tetratricopeptide repeat protein [Bacteroidales bacterium]